MGGLATSRAARPQGQRHLCAQKRPQGQRHRPQFKVQSCCSSKLAGEEAVAVLLGPSALGCTVSPRFRQQQPPPSLSPQQQICCCASLVASLRGFGRSSFREAPSQRGPGPPAASRSFNDSPPPPTPSDQRSRRPLTCASAAAAAARLHCHLEALEELLRPDCLRPPQHRSTQQHASRSSRYCSKPQGPLAAQQQQQQLMVQQLSGASPLPLPTPNSAPLPQSGSQPRAAARGTCSCCSREEAADLRIHRNDAQTQAASWAAAVNRSSRGLASGFRV